MSTTSSLPVVNTAAAAAATNVAEDFFGFDTDKPSKKKVKRPDDLPQEIERMTEKECLAAITVVDEVNPGTRRSTKNEELSGVHPVAKFITYKKEIVCCEPGGAPVTKFEDCVLDIDSLSLDRVRALCRHVGVKNVSSTPKWLCRYGIAAKISVVGKFLKNPVVPTASKEGQSLNSLLRLANAVFHDDIRDRVFTVNDKKDRSDHETGNTEKAIYASLVELYNQTSCDRLLDEVLDPFEGKDDDDEDVRKDYLNTLPEYLNANPRDFIPFVDAAAAKVKVSLLFQIRKTINDLMDVSGTNDSDVMNFIDSARFKVKGAKSVPKLGMYYFYYRCEEYPGIDAKFCPLLDEWMKGSTQDPSRWVTNNRKQQKKGPDRIAAVTNAIGDLAQVFKDALAEETKLSQANILFKMMSSEITSPNTKERLKNQIIDSCTGPPTAVTVTNSKRRYSSSASSMGRDSTGNVVSVSVSRPSTVARPSTKRLQQAQNKAKATTDSLSSSSSSSDSED
jgi:hypothetical protein